MHIGYFASEISTEDVKKLARQVSRKRRTFLTATKPVTDAERLFAGGAIGNLSTEKSGLGFMDKGNNNVLCS